MDWSMLAVNVVLVLVTGVYVVLTSRLARTAAAANQLARDTASENQRLQLYPQIFLHFELEGERYNMVVRNLSENGAGDADVLLVGQYDESETPVPIFVKSHVRPEYRSGPKVARLQPDDEGFYGVYHHFAYYTLPPKQQVVAEVGFPMLPQSIHVLLQYRDSFGTNYSRVLWFFLGGGRPRLGSVEPISVSVTDRIEFGADDFFSLATESGAPLPNWVVESEFANAWAHALPAGWISGWNGEIEDSGAWSRI